MSKLSKLSKIRRTNILQLIENYPDRISFAKACGLNKSQLSQITRKDDEAVAIGNKVARRVEAANQLPNGWLDIKHEKKSIDVSEHDLEIITKSCLAVIRQLEEAGIATSSLNDTKLSQMLFVSSKSSLYGDKANIESHFDLLDLKGTTAH